jgi:hypothetical protein
MDATITVTIQAGGCEGIRSLTYRLALFMYHGITIVVFDGETKTGWINVPVAPEKQRAENRLS